MSVRDELLAYCDSVLAGEVMACQKHKWACLRFKNDIDRSGTEAFPYVFRSEDAERFFGWVKLFKHRKGVLTGKFIELHPIQRFLLGQLYGWYHKDSGRRRFTKLYWQVARKNAKSQSLACVASYETMVFGKGVEQEAAEVYCAATKSEQAKIVYDETVAMLDGCALLKGKYRVAYGRLTHIKSGSVLRVLSEEDRKTGDGLNPQCGIIDEYHAHETSEIYDIVESGMGARSQPLLAVITTAGFELNYPCYRVEYNLASRILDPNIPMDLDNYLVLINELDKDDKGELLDNLKDEAVWEKANPIACSYKEGRDNLRLRFAEAQEAPEKMRNFLTKHMDIWIQQGEHGYMLADRWAACKAAMPDLSGARCWVGLDLSAKIDLTSICWEVVVDEKYYVLSHSFIPADTMAAKERTDKVPYSLWASQGWLTVIDGAVIDYRVVRDYALSFAKERGLRIQEVCIDPWSAAQISASLQEEGFTVVEIVQGIRTLSEPTKDFRNCVYQRRVVHDGSPLLAWAINNAVVDTVDRNENIVLSKKKSTQRIDPIAAVVNAHVRAMLADAMGGYNSRGMRGF